MEAVNDQRFEYVRVNIREADEHVEAQEDGCLLLLLLRLVLLLFSLVSMSNRHFLHVYVSLSVRPSVRPPSSIDSSDSSGLSDLAHVVVTVDLVEYIRRFMPSSANTVAATASYHRVRASAYLASLRDEDRRIPVPREESSNLARGEFPSAH